MSLDFEESESEKILRSTVREFARKEIAPHARKWDEEESFPSALVPKLAELGLMGMKAPEALGGAGMSTQDVAIVIEELARVDG
ncbi:MAG TPA: acyl-CoA dehydrogenase family protein, partial [Polyangia bacterium]